MPPGRREQKRRTCDFAGPNGARCLKDSEPQARGGASAEAEPQAQQTATTEGCGSSMPSVQSSPQMSSGYDQDESQMAKSQLYSTAEYASELEQMIQDGEELDAWVQAKITKASDYLSSVKHYLQYKKTKGDQ